MGANVYVELLGEDKSVELLTDAAGGFSVEVAQPIWYDADICAYAPGYTLSEARLKQRGNVITLGSGASISGTVTAADGKPLAGVPVRLLSVNWMDNKHLPYVPDAWRARFTALSAADGSCVTARHPGGPLLGVARPRWPHRYVHDKLAVECTGGKTDAPCTSARAPAQPLPVAC